MGMTKPKTAPESEALSKVSVRLIAEDERERFDELLEKEHYMHSARVGGQSLRYVAEVDGQWVALLIFSGAAPHTKAREQKSAGRPGSAPGGWALWLTTAGFWFCPSANAIPIWPRVSGAVSQAAQRRLASAVGPSGGLGGELCG